MKPDNLILKLQKTDAYPHANLCNGRETIVERCQATIACFSLLGSSRYSKDTEFFNAFLPNGKSMMLEVDSERAKLLKGSLAVQATVTISKPVLQRATCTAVSDSSLA